MVAGYMLRGLIWTAIALVGLAPAFGAGELELSARAFDAGEVELGQIVIHDFVLTNVGDQPVSVTSVRAQCGCSVVDYPNVIEPGDAGAIRVEIHTVDLHTGKTSKTVTVVTDSANEPRIVFQMRMRLHTALEFLPKPMVYMRTAVGQAREERLLVRPHRDGMEVTDVSCEDQHLVVRMEPAEAPGNHDERTGLASVMMPRNGDSWIVVKVKNSAPAGFHRSEVVVRTTDPELPKATVNVTYAVDEPKS